MTKVKLFLLILMPLWLLFASGASYGRYAAIMIDADNGNVLHEVEATHPWYPASLTKVMTLYMTFDALSSGRLHLHDRLTASYHAARQPNSKLGLRRGESLTVEEAILAVITRSANDAAVVLAERLGGSEEAFAVKMTTMARTLGMNDTRFMNATGLPNDWQVTTSRDMAILAWKIMHNFSNYYPYFSAHSFYYKGRELRGINKFTAKYPGAEGMKTGFTCGSGFNLIGAAQQNGKHLIGVVLGGMTSAERYQLMMNMMDKGFSSYYGGDSTRNIATMPAGFGGVPPYQLSCGSRGGVTQGDSTDSKQYKKHRSVKRKLAGSGKRYHKGRHPAGNKKFASRTRHAGKSTRVSSSKNKKVVKTRRVSKTKAAANSKRVARSKSAKAGSKPAAKAKSVKSTRYYHNH